MQIHERPKGDIIICALDGEITINTVSLLKKKFSQFVQRKSKKVLVNFKNVDYIDSTGLAALIELSKNLESLKGRLCLTNLSIRLQSIFGITKLEKAFTIYATEEEALRGLV